MLQNTRLIDTSLNISKIQLFGESILKETDPGQQQAHSFKHKIQSMLIKLLKIAQLYLHITLHSLIIFYEMKPTLLTFVSHAILWFFL